jgi:aminoglycoside phosphotransferase family enzyme/predicted kinase
MASSHATGPEPLIRALRNPNIYPESERPPRVEMIETHVSWLFFAGEYVYKVKKPVDFGFLDFTSLAKRVRYCHEEVELNRRLSPDVYLGTVDIREDGGSYSIDGPGQTVEIAVKMRRLPKDGWLANRLARGEATAEDLRRIARRIAEFHQAAETSSEVSRIGGLEAVRFNTEENFEQTHPYVGSTVSSEAYDTIRAYTWTFLERRESLFHQREREGRIRDCHGDLHLAQINLEDGISFIDCIEFNPRLRYGDVAVDVAFTAMDLDFHGRPDLADTFIAEYVAQSGDPGVLEVLDFYKCYRAYVRGKIESLRSDQNGLGPHHRGPIRDRARGYFDLAKSYATPDGPALIIMTGLMGTGKSALAEALVKRLDAALISSDRVRKELAGLTPEERREVSWGEGIYAPDFSERVYETLHRRALERLRSGQLVMVDASYQYRSWREAASRAASSAPSRFLIVETACPLDVVRHRLEDRRARRTDPSDGRLALLETQRAHFEPVDEVQVQNHVRVDTSTALPDVTLQALQEVYRRLLD